MAGVSLIVFLMWLGWINDGGSVFGSLMTEGGVAGLFFGFPVALYFGHFWGQAFATVVGAQADSSVEIGEPPHLTQRP